MRLVIRMAVISLGESKVSDTLVFSAKVFFLVNRQEHFQLRNETTREVYLGPRARAIVFS